MTTSETKAKSMAGLCKTDGTWVVHTCARCKVMLTLCYMFPIDGGGYACRSVAACGKRARKAKAAA